MNKKISSTFGILVILIIAIILGVVFMIRINNDQISEKNNIEITPIQNEETKIVACTKETKLCPDGSIVSRVAPDCEFEKCPEETSWSFIDGRLRDYKYGFSGDLPKNFFVEDEWDEIANEEDFKRIFRISNYRNKFSIVDAPDDLILFYLFIEKKDKCQEVTENINEWKLGFKNINIKNICEDENSCYVIPPAKPLVIGSFCYNLGSSMTTPDTSNFDLITYKLNVIKEFVGSIEFQHPQNFN